MELYQNWIPLWQCKPKYFLLFQGPIEVGNLMLGREGVLQLILALIESGNAIHTVWLQLLCHGFTVQ